jgi:hypothetical protein
MRLKAMLMVAILGAAPVAFAGGPTKGSPAPAKTPAAPKKKPAPPVSAEHKKKLLELMAGFKFGMSKDDVLGVLQKKVDEAYDDKLKQTADVAAQDRIRKDKKSDVARISQSYVSFDGKKGGWDVSIVENEFAHNTNESMMEMWEKDGDKNQRRFFFFYEGKLWRMFVSLDVTKIPEEKRNFETFRAVMEGQYGAGDVEPGLITWRAGEAEVRAIDRLKDYGALGLAISDAKVQGEVYALRESKKPPAHETNSVIKAVVDTDHKDHPDIKSNGGAVDAVIQAQGGGGTTPPPPKK